MGLTSSLFILAFLPWIICLRVFFQGIAQKKIMLLIANTLLYAIGGGTGCLLCLLIYTFFTWLLGIANNYLKNRIILYLSVFFLLLPLLCIKYCMCIVLYINRLFAITIDASKIVVPVGISFVTFQALSFVVDLYKTKTKISVSVLDVYLYLSFFCTITAGPIIRYGNFIDDLINRNEIEYTKAIERLVIGVAKKVLIADKLALLVNYYFDGIGSGEVFSPIGLWIGSLAYSLQIYFDFSGYSDMSIGIGEMLGVTIPENFNKPYLAKSLTDFWRCWHISLSKWLRDYVYIPLGGNKCSLKRCVFNLLIVWLITGMWHGADSTFLVWGVCNFIVIALEKYTRLGIVRHKWIGHLYTIMLVNVFWIPFRANNLDTAILYIKEMVDFSATQNVESKALYYLPLVFGGILFCLPWEHILHPNILTSRSLKAFRGGMLLVVIFASICALINQNYSPYIYGNF